MKQTGQILRECREKKGLSTSEVALATKIGVKIIEAIERGDVSALPPKAFLRGFIQTYATYLKLDTKEIMVGYLEETGGKDRRTDPHSAPNPMEAPKAPAPLSFENKNNKVIIQIAVVVVVLIVVSVAKFLFNTIEKYELDGKPPSPAEIATTLKTDPINVAPDVADTTSPANTAPEKVATPPTQLPTKTAPPPVVTPPKPAPAPAPTPAPVPTAAPTKPILPTDVVAATTSAAKVEPPPVMNVKPEAQKKALSTETGASIQSKEIIIEALDAVDIVYWVDDGTSKKVHLEPDQIQIIKAAKNIKIEVSDGGAIDVIYNGEDQGVPGKLGKSMKLSYP